MGLRKGALAVIAALLFASVAVSGGTRADPRSPMAAPGLPPPFLGIAELGAGGMLESVDAYGDVVGLRAGPLGRDLIDVSPARQRAGSLSSRTGITARVAQGDGGFRAPWSGSGFRQRFRPHTDVLVSGWRAGGVSLRTVDAVDPRRPGFARLLVARGVREPVTLRLDLNLHGADRLACLPSSAPTRERSHRDRVVMIWRAPRLRIGLVCSLDGRPEPARGVIAAAARASRHWLARARPLRRSAPGWAKRLYARSLLVLRAAEDGRSGAIAAGPREGWNYVWPRDAAAATLALASAGYRREAHSAASFLRNLEPARAARFRGDGAPAPNDPGPAGDARGWIALAARAGGLPTPPSPNGWRGRGDYAERAGQAGEFLGNAIAAGIPARRLRGMFEVGGALTRAARDPGSGLDSAAAWAVHPFRRPGLRSEIEATLLRLVARSGRFGITPGSRFPGGGDPWTAPTAWTAWALLGLGERHQADRLLDDLRRAATGASLLPERVSRVSGRPISTTPLTWSHAFAILALRARYPSFR